MQQSVTLVSQTIHDNHNVSVNWPLQFVDHFASLVSLYATCTT